jgi:alpha 1,3-mannosyltransferase
VGWAHNGTGGTGKVCSFISAPVDEKDKLLWYNGSLLKDKAVDSTTFEVPKEWMIDEKWEKGGKQDIESYGGWRG